FGSLLLYTRREQQRMENLLCNFFPLLSSIAALALVFFLIHLYATLLLKSEKIRRKLRMQGIKGPPQGSVYTYSTGLRQHLYVNEPELVKEMNQNISLDLGKPPYLTKRLAPMLGNGILRSNGLIWAQQRKIVAPEFYMDKGMVGLMVESSQPLLKRWEECIEAAQGGMTADVKVDDDLRGASADVISRACFGSSYSKGRQIFSKLRTLQKAIANQSLPFSVTSFGSRIFQLKKQNQIDNLEKEIESLIWDAVKERGLESTCASSKKDLMQLILEGAINDQSLGEDSSRRFIVDNCKTIYFAGHESTAVAASWCLMLLALHPEWQHCIRAELAQVCKDHSLDADSILHLKTALRLYPPAAFVSREALEETRVGDITIPKGVCLWTLIPTLHRDPAIWGTDVNEFKPERFSEGVSKACKYPQAYIPFGVGPRLCLGKNFAMVQLKVLLSTIVSKFEFTLSPNYHHCPTYRMIVEPGHGVAVGKAATHHLTGGSGSTRRSYSAATTTTMEIRWATRKYYPPNKTSPPPRQKSKIPIFLSTKPSHVNPHHLSRLFTLCNHSCHRFPKLDPEEGRVVVEPIDVKKLEVALCNSSVVVSVFCESKYVDDDDEEESMDSEGEGKKPLQGFGDLLQRVVPLPPLPLASVSPENGRLVGFGRAVSDLGLTASIYDVMVIPSLWGMGIGTMIVKRIIRLFFKACGFRDDDLVGSTTMMYAKTVPTSIDGDEAVIWVEVCLISARGLRRTSALWKLQWFAVGWIDPNNKYCTKIDASGNANPTWKTKFATLVDDSNFQDMALHVEVYSREPIFLRERLEGTASIVLKEFLAKYSKNSEASSSGAEEVGSYQLRKRNSNKPQGFVDVSIHISEDREGSRNEGGIVLMERGNNNAASAEGGFGKPFPTELPLAPLRRPENQASSVDLVILRQLDQVISHLELHHLHHHRPTLAILHKYATICNRTRKGWCKTWCGNGIRCRGTGCWCCDFW
ncbi:hypothetical protein Tsubulata_014056, partial [Turnera subulata]